MNVATAPTSAQYSFSAPSEVSALKKLPAQAIAKFEKLRALETRATALRDGLWTAMETARENLSGAKRDLANFDKLYGESEVIVVEDEKAEPDANGNRPRVRINRENPNRVDLRLQVERLQQEVARLQAEQKATNLGFNTSDIVAFLSSSPATFVAVAPSKVVVEKGQSLSDCLAQIRARQSEVRDEIVATENAPLTSAEAKQAMRAQIAAIAEKGAPDISGLMHGLPVAWPTELLVSSGHVPNAVTVVADVKSTFPFSVWLHQEQLIRKLSEAIDNESEQNGQSALSQIDRSAKLIALNKSLTSLLRSEEATICKIEESGGTVQRTTRDPLILLGIEARP